METGGAQDKHQHQHSCVANNSSNKNNNNSNRSRGSSNGRLQELQLAFCLLSNEIECLNDDKDQAPNGIDDREMTSHSPATKSAVLDPPQERSGFAPRVMVNEGTHGRLGSPSLTMGSETVLVEKPAGCLKKLTAASSAGGPNATDGTEKETQRTLRRLEEELVAETERRKSSQAASAEAERALNRLKAELSAERRSRIAAESALQQLQMRAAGAVVEREKLVRVVNSFCGHPMEELTADVRLKERRLREAEQALADSRKVAADKENEALETMRALDAERIARGVAEEERKNTTQQLRRCLRGRAKAEHDAREAGAALKKSEAQKASLAQRLEVLRAAKKRLDKRISADWMPPASGDAEDKGNGGAGNTATRLSVARARLKTLSARDGRDIKGTALHTVAEGRRPPKHGDNEGQASIERATSVVLAEKKWRNKLRDAETRGDAYRSAAAAAETGLKSVVRRKAELEEINSVLTKRLELEPSAGKGGKQKNISERGAIAGENGGPSLVVNDPSTTQQTEGGGTDAARVVMWLHDPSGETTFEEGEDSQPCTSGLSSCSLDRARELPAVDDVPGPAVATTPSLNCPMDKNRQTTAESGRNKTSMITSEGTTMISTTCRRLRVEVDEHPTPPQQCSLRSARRSHVSTDTHRIGARISSQQGNDETCYYGRSRPRSASIGDTSLSSSPRRGGINPRRAQGEEQQQQHHQQQKQQQQDLGIAVEPNKPSHCCSSAVPFNQLLSESRQLREEVLSAVRNGPFGREGSPSADSNIGGGGRGGRGGFDGDGGRGGEGGGRSGGGGDNGLDGDWCGERTTPCYVPIEVLLRLCDRSVRGPRYQREFLPSDTIGVAYGAKEPFATHQYGDDGVWTVEDSKKRNYDRSAVESPVREVGTGVFGVLTTDEVEVGSPAVSLPSGITSALAQQVQGAVSRGDERGFLTIVERCGSTAREGIARLLSIDAPEL